MMIDIKYCWECGSNPDKYGCNYIFPVKADSDDIGEWKCKAPQEVRDEVKRAVEDCLGKIK